MNKINNNPILGFKIETIPFTSENLIQEDFKYSVNNDIKIINSNEIYEQKLNIGDYSKFQSINGKQSCAINFTINLYINSNDTTSAPSYFTILKCCGWKQIDTISGLSIFPDDLQNRNTATIEIIYPNENNEPKQIVYKIFGAVGSVKFIGNTSLPLIAEFTFIGSLEKIYTKTFEEIITTDSFDDLTPFILDECTMQINDQNISVDNFEINSNEFIDLFTNNQKQSGYDGGKIIARNTEGFLTLNTSVDDLNSIYYKIINNENNDFYLKKGYFKIESTDLQFLNVNDDLTKYNIFFPKNIIIKQETDYIPPINYGDAILARNPLNYWRLNESSGTTVYDLGSLALNGTYLNNPSLQQESPPEVNDNNRCIRTYTTGQKTANLGHSDQWALNTNGIFLLECWYKLINVGTFTSIINKYYTEPNGFMFYLRVESNLKVSYYVACKDLIQSHYISASTSNAVIVINQWHYVVFIINTNTKTVYLYIDNQLVSSKYNQYFIGPLNINGTNYKLIPCGFMYNIFTTNAYIDEIAIYDNDWYTSLEHKDWYNYL